MRSASLTRLLRRQQEAFPEMDGMRPDVDLAGATQVLGGHREAVERVRAVHEDVMRDDVPVLERERVQAAPEFGRSAAAVACRGRVACQAPASSALAARSAYSSCVDQRERLHRRLDDARVRPRVRAEHHHGLQPGAEDAGKVVGQGASRLQRCHAGILSNAERRTPNAERRTAE